MINKVCRCFGALECHIHADIGGPNFVTGSIKYIFLWEIALCRWYKKLQVVCFTFKTRKKCFSGLKLNVHVLWYIKVPHTCRCKWPKLSYRWYKVLSYRCYFLYTKVPQTFRSHVLPYTKKIELTGGREQVTSGIYHLKHWTHFLTGGA